MGYGNTKRFDAGYVGSGTQRRINGQIGFLRPTAKANLVFAVFVDIDIPETS